MVCKDKDVVINKCFTDPCSRDGFTEGYTTLDKLQQLDSPRLCRAVWYEAKSFEHFSHWNSTIAQSSPSTREEAVKKFHKVRHHRTRQSVS